MKKSKLFIGAAVFLLIGCLGFWLIWQNVSRHYRTQFNRETAALLEAVHETYPDVPEQELIQFVKNDHEVKDSGFLEQYGYDDSFLYSSAAGQYERNLLLYSLLYFTVLALLAFLLYFFHEKKRGEKVEELIRYTQDIARGVYDLKLDENSETSLSRLSNALYKVTVRLKESAETSRMESEALSRSLQDISHQLKTPLTSIRIMLDNIEEDPDMDPEVRQDFLRSISSQIDRISQLTISLLHLARFDSGAIVLNPKEVVIGQLIDEAFENLSALAEVQDVSLVSSGDLDTVWTLDRKWELEALSNIIKNSIEHSPEGSTVSVTVTSSSLLLKLIVEDQGEGIAAEDRRHVFERFYKAKNSSESSIGIGLSFAKTIIERESGNITVESEEGKGTRFVIRFTK